VRLAWFFVNIMDLISWNKFVKIREKFRKEVDELSASLPQLNVVQQELVNNRSEVSYKIETPVVYNSALDEITPENEIKLILVADNPGRREQAAENRRYLVGPSGKIAGKFLRENPSLGIDFTKNVIILNKTPVHTPRTVELRELCKIDKEEVHTEARRHGGHGEEFRVTLRDMLDKSQNFMADLLLEFYKVFECSVWIIGYSEMRKKGIFEVYTERLKELCGADKDFYKQLFFYRHFSMNQFTIDLKQQALPDESVSKSLKRIGKAYRERILGKI